jgi:hypothetical protein
MENKVVVQQIEKDLPVAEPHQKGRCPVDAVADGMSRKVRLSANLWKERGRGTGRGGRGVGWQGPWQYTKRPFFELCSFLQVRFVTLI